MSVRAAVAAFIASFKKAGSNDDANFDKVVALLHFDSGFYDVVGNTWSGSSGSIATDPVAARFGRAGLRPTAASANLSSTGAGAKAQMPGDFTVETWAYIPHTNAITNTAVVSLGNESTGRYAFYIAGGLPCHNVYGVGGTTAYGATQVPRNSWFHLVWAREGSTIRCYINGVQVGTQTAAGTIGNVNGFANVANLQAADSVYLDELRITKDLCRYPGGTTFAVPSKPFPDCAPDALYTYVASLLHFEGLDDSTKITDEVKSVVWTANGNARLSTAQSRTGGSALYLDGVGDYLSTPSGLAIAGDFALEAWIRPESLSTIFSILDTRAAGYQNGVLFYVQTNGTLAIEWRTPGSTAGGLGSAAGVVVAGVWTHVAWVRIGSTSTLYVNGVSVYSGNGGGLNAGNFSNGSGRIGWVFDNNAGYAAKGWIDELRLTTGNGRYPSAFTPPVAMGGPGTSIAMSFNAGNGSTTFTDSGTAGSVWTIGSGAVVCSTAVVLEGASSLFIPAGGTAYLTAASSPANLLPATRDFSLKFRAQAPSWLRPDSAGCYLLSIQDASATASLTQFAIATNSSQQPSLAYSNGTTRTVANGAASLPANTPIEFELVRTGTALVLKVNGVAAVSVTLAAGFAFPQPSTPWRIGCPAGATGGPTSGMYFDAFTLSVSA